MKLQLFLTNFSLGDCLTIVPEAISLSSQSRAIVHAPRTAPEKHGNVVAPPYSNWSLIGAEHRRLSQMAVLAFVVITHMFVRFYIPLLRLGKFKVAQGQRRSQFRM